MRIFQVEGSLPQSHFIKTGLPTGEYILPQTNVVILPQTLKKRRFYVQLSLECRVSSRHIHRSKRSLHNTCFAFNKDYCDKMSQLLIHLRR